MAQDYVVGFTIFNARSLQTQDGNACDPFVVVECCGLTYQTETAIEKILLVPWNETCVWPLVRLVPQEFDSACIEFKVYARYWFTRNYLIGKASLQLSTINNRTHHLYARRWLTLRREDGPSVTGMLNVTVYCLKPGEQAPSATQQETAVDDGEEAAAAGGASLEEENLTSSVIKAAVDAPAGKPHHVMINIHRVEDLQCDGGYKPSPYITVEFNGCLVKTVTAKEVTHYTFNECARIPAMTPLYEDTILIKLWNDCWYGSDGLLAQGLVSFSELRNNSLPPRWFNLYGWDPEEIPDVSAISTATGLEPEANYFRGRILISGRVDRLDEVDDLEPAKSMPTKSIVEPNMMQRALFADVYMVNGADGWNAMVRVSFGILQGDTELVTYGTGKPENPFTGESDDSEAETLEDEKKTIHYFSQKQGRIKPLLMMTPEETRSQPFVMVSVYTESTIKKLGRIGYAKRTLFDFPEYDAGNPHKPNFIAMETMPDNTGTRYPPAVLITVETHTTDDIVRHSRKVVKPMPYIVRAYCFMARNIKYENMAMDKEPSKYALRVSCAGVAQMTKFVQGPRPFWMTPINLKVFLCSDSAKEPPTMEPITLTLSEEKGFLSSYVSNGDIGKAVAVYTHMRRKDNLGQWEHYELKPQWVKVFGGTYGRNGVGEILVCFDLMNWSFREHTALQPLEMWPQPEEEYQESVHFCKLKKATLHFSMHGLRDILPLPSLLSLSTTQVKAPSVHVEVQRMFVDKLDENDQEVDQEKRRLLFKYAEVIPGGDKRVKGECLKSWHAPANGVICSNFEFLQVGRLNVYLPESPLLQPCIIIKVMEEGPALFGYDSFVGESLQTLEHAVPLCWLQDLNMEKSIKDQQNIILEKLQKLEESAKPREQFKQLSEKELREFLSERRDLMAPHRPNAAKKEVVKSDKETAQLDSTGLPLELRGNQHVRRALKLKPRDCNMQLEQGFDAQKGEAAREIGSGNSRKVCYKKLENSRADPFWHDFHYKNVPLLRNHDVIDRNNEDVDWNYQPGRVFGFVKCTYKLTDGWPEEEEKQDDAAPAESDDDDDDEPTVEETERWKESFSYDKELNNYAYDEKKLFKRFKSPANLPGRIRCRIYLVKAVCIYSKTTGFADPYLNFHLGQSIFVSMRNMVQMNTNTPEFYRVEERDIEMPEDSRLEIKLMDMQELGAIGFSDSLIGSTVIDLEDRWHSKKWQKRNMRQNVPTEQRSLFTNEYVGKNRGNLEMWIEMIESVRSSDMKPSELRRPPDTEIELRFVVWKTANVRLVAGDTTYTNVRIGMQFDCKEYMGEYPSSQLTDVHFNSQDGNAIFNWRMVYPRIKMPTKSATVNVKLYHSELLAGDTLIGTFDIDVKRYFERVANTLDALIIGPHDLPFQEPKVSHDDGGGDDGGPGPESAAEDDVGSVNLTLYVMTSTEAQGRRAGIARDEPNEDPQLITPTEGRDWGTYLATFGFSLPSFNLWKKLIPLVIMMVLFLVSVIALKQMGIL